MQQSTDPRQLRVGVVGLGLMGSSIVAALLVAGHRVEAIAPLPDDLPPAWDRIAGQLRLCAHAGLLERPPEAYAEFLTIGEDYARLRDCALVLECVTEDLAVKESVYRRIEAVVAPDAVLASNTSAIPISLLQRRVAHPARFLGIHWAEPACLTRFLEITCGDQTDPAAADWVYQLAHRWRKEPTLLRRDIRGFVTNRLMYAVYREAFHLVETGVATQEDADRAFRYDVGSWITLMGVFRRLDYLGLHDYAAVFTALFPQLSNADRVPERMRELIARRARGTQTADGLYDYTEAEARRWDAAFAAFNQEIYQLAAQYPAGDHGEPPRT